MKIFIFFCYAVIFILAAVILIINSKIELNIKFKYGSSEKINTNNFKYRIDIILNLFSKFRFTILEIDNAIDKKNARILKFKINKNRLLLILLKLVEKLNFNTITFDLKYFLKEKKDALKSKIVVKKKKFNFSIMSNGDKILFNLCGDFRICIKTLNVIKIFKSVYKLNMKMKNTAISKGRLAKSI